MPLSINKQDVVSVTAKAFTTLTGIVRRIRIILMILPLPAIGPKPVDLTSIKTRAGFGLFQQIIGGTYRLEPALAAVASG